MKPLGFSLEEIRQWLLMREEMGTEHQLSIFVEYADRQLNLLRTQRRELDATITELSELRDETVGVLKGLKARNGTTT